MGLLNLIKRNILYRPVRNGALIFCYALISASLFSGNYILASASDSAQTGLSRLGADIIVTSQDYNPKSEPVILRTEPTTSYINQSYIYTLQSIEDIQKIAPQIFLGTINLSQSQDPVDIIAIDENKDFTITPWLKSREKKSLYHNEVYVGSQISSDPGSDLIISGDTFHVAGNLDPTGTDVDSSVFIRIDDGRRLSENSISRDNSGIRIPDGKVSAFLIKVENSSNAQDISYQIVNKIWGIRVHTPEVLISSVSAHLNSVTGILILASIVASILSLPLIALISIMAANERLRETGVLRALGASKKTIFALIFGESVFIATIGGLAGVLISLGIIIIFRDQIGKISQIPLNLPPLSAILQIIIIALTLTISIGGLASFYPAYKNALMEPYAAIRSGEL